MSAVLLRQGRAKGCVQSDGRIPAGYSSPGSCLHCHKEGQKEGSTEGGAWKGSGCIMISDFSSLLEGSACECGTDDGAGVGQYLLMDYFLFQSQQRGLLYDGFRCFPRAAQGMRQKFQNSVS